MSVNIMTVRELIKRLEQFNGNDEVVVCRDANYAVHSDIVEYDGVKTTTKIKVSENSSVYLPDNDNGHKVVVLSSTPLDFLP